MGSAAVHVIARAGHTASVLHALRLRLLGELGEAEVAAELARRLGVPRQLVIYHLCQLERDGSWRPRVNDGSAIAPSGSSVRSRSYAISPSALGSLAAHRDSGEVPRPRDAWWPPVSLPDHRVPPSGHT